MQKEIFEVFNPEHVKLVKPEKPDENFPHTIGGIACKHCDYTIKSSAMQMALHLQYNHKLKIKEIFPKLR